MTVPVPTSPDLPLLGAALSRRTLPLHRQWLLDHQRDLEIQDFIEHALLDGDAEAVADEIAGMLDGYRGRLGLHGPFWGFRISTEDPLVRAVVQKRFLQGLAVAERLGATQMVIHSPFTTWDFNNLDAFPGAEARLVERVAECLAPVIVRARDIGCELVIENIEDKDPSARVRLAEVLGEPVRVSLDTGHAHYAHISTGAPPVDVYVHKAGPALAHVHLQDMDGYADRHWHPGEGSVNWPAIFRALAVASSAARLILEVKDQANLMKGANHLVALGLAR
ncbi:MAG: sugar phosphate isomerase/epimerase [Beijerinckiaceae bacterium]|nr:sugar phosphate isomerase/epimerase [Beijerinckiaceae bacterium]MCZ8300231.1 sugar phosphate isomerase/epimerase [Beijerinckiaceae bacterium]